MEELKACPLLEYLNKHRAKCAKKSKMTGYWFCSELEDIHSDLQDRLAISARSELE